MKGVSHGDEPTENSHLNLSLLRALMHISCYYSGDPKLIELLSAKSLEKLKGPNVLSVFVL